MPNRTASVLLLFFICLSPAWLTAQVSKDAATSVESRSIPKIQDNSFLVEEAYNQDYGMVQHIQTFQRMYGSHTWLYSFTQEWPVQFAPKHQLSYTIPFVNAGIAGSGVGDVSLNYRYQLIGSAESKLAFAPRLSLLLPTGAPSDGSGTGGTGLQINLPLSIVHSGRLTTHWNAGATFIHGQKNVFGQAANTSGLNAAQSFVWTAKPRINFLLETVWNYTPNVIAPAKFQREHSVLISPGIRWAYNLPNGTQIVPGVAIPTGVGPSSGDAGLLLYFSIEHPFARKKSR